MSYFEDFSYVVFLESEGETTREMFDDASEETTNEVEASLRALLLVCRSGGAAFLDNHHDTHESDCS